MVEEDDIKFPTFGQFGDPESGSTSVCQWCGKEGNSRLIQGKACSHRCNAALEWKQYRYFPRMIPIFVILFLIVIVTFQANLQSLIISVTLLILLFIPMVYGTWMSWVGGKMRIRSLEKMTS